MELEEEFYRHKKREEIRERVKSMKMISKCIAVRTKMFKKKFKNKKFTGF